MATHLFAGLPVADLDPALDWHARLWGRPPDNRPNDDEAVWQLVETGLIYVVRDPDRAGNGIITVIVEDLDATVAPLVERGIERPELEVMVGIARRATVTDPAGNRIVFAQLTG